MTQTVLTPCPTCGKRFDFPLTGYITGVADQLIASSNGNCPGCGTLIVADEPPTEYRQKNPFVDASSLDAVRRVAIVNLELSVRCRLALTKMDATSVGDLLDFGRDAVIFQVRECSGCAEDLLTLFADNNVDW